MKSAPEGKDQDARGDHANAYPIPNRRAFAQEDDGEHRDEHETELVDGRHLGSIANLERAKVAHPRGTGRENTVTPFRCLRIS